jgi:transposase-like protein
MATLIQLFGVFATKLTPPEMVSDVFPFMCRLLNFSAPCFEMTVLRDMFLRILGNFFASISLLFFAEERATCEMDENSEMDRTSYSSDINEDFVNIELHGAGREPDTSIRFNNGQIPRSATDLRDEQFQNSDDEDEDIFTDDTYRAPELGRKRNMVSKPKRRTLYFKCASGCKIRQKPKTHCGRWNWTMLEKAQALDFIESGQYTVASLARHLGASASTISTWVSQKEKIRRLVDEGISNSTCRERGRTFPIIEQALLMFIKDQNAKATSSALSHEVLMQTANQ